MATKPKLLTTPCDNLEAYLGGFFLELLNSSLVDSAAFVDQMASCCRLARVYVADNDDVDMNLFFRHCFSWKIVFLFDEMFLLKTLRQRGSTLEDVLREV